MKSFCFYYTNNDDGRSWRPTLCGPATLMPTGACPSSSLSPGNFFFCDVYEDEDEDEDDHDYDRDGHFCPFLLTNPCPSRSVSTGDVVITIIMLNHD